MRIYELFKRQLLVAHVYSIPVRIDYRWFVVWALMSWLTAINLPDTLIENFAGKLALGVITMFVFFGSVFAHELAHALVARTEGIDVVEILLHPFGGVARLGREPLTPKSELRIAIAGPGASFIVAMIFLGLWAASSAIRADLLTPAFFLLFLLNLFLVIFNLFPGYPLDGGRILRAYLWRRGTDLGEATVLTGKFGQIIAVALIFFGIAITFISLDLFAGLWTVVVGLFLFDSATGIIRRTQRFEGLIAENVMELPFGVDPEMNLMEFIDTVLPLYRQTSFAVVQGKRLAGFLLLGDVKAKIPKDKWLATKVGDIMRPVRDDYFIESAAGVAEARELMRGNGIGAVAVIDSKGNFVGMIERGRVRRRS